MTQQMRGSDGGTSAAHGFYYQYLVTLERLLDLAEEAGGDQAVVRVDADQEVVDFSVTDDSGLIELTQVKATLRPLDPTTSMSGPEAERILIRLLDSSPAHRLRILTNRRLSGPLAKLAALLNGSTADTLRQAARKLAPTLLDEVERRDGWHQLSRARIDIDHRSSDDLRAELIGRLAVYRRTNGLGAGASHSTPLLLNHLLSEVFRRGTGTTDATFTVADFRTMLQMRDATLARGAAIVDWGQPWGPLPAKPAIHREVPFAQLTDRLGNAVLARAPQVAVLTGLSGIGKSSLAAAYAHTFAAHYDHVLWLDATSTVGVQEQIADFLTDATGTPHQPEDCRLRQQLHELLARTSATWLLILDDAQSRDTVEPWIPTVGYGNVIITTIDQTLLPNIDSIRVERLSDDEAHALLNTRLGLTEEQQSADDRRTVQDIGAELENWPLALELAAAWMRASGRGLRVSDEYIRRLRQTALNRADLRPSGYPRSLTAAVLLSLERVRAEERGPWAMRLLQAVSYLTPAGTPLHFAIAITEVQASSATAAVLWPSTAAIRERRHLEDLTDECCAALSKASLAERRAQPRLAGVDELRLNDVVAQIVREEVEVDADQTHITIGSVLQHGAAWVSTFVHHQNNLTTLKAIRPGLEDLLIHMSRLELASVDSLALMGDLASSYLTQGDPQQASVWLTGEVLHFPHIDHSVRQEYFTYATLARCHAELGDTDQACAACEEAFTVAETPAAQEELPQWEDATRHLSWTVTVLAMNRPSPVTDDLAARLTHLLEQHPLTRSAVDDIFEALNDLRWDDALKGYAGLDLTQLKELEHYHLRCSLLQAFTGHAAAGSSPQR